MDASISLLFYIGLPQWWLSMSSHSHSLIDTKLLNAQGPLKR